MTWQYILLTNKHFLLAHHNMAHSSLPTAMENLAKRVPASPEEQVIQNHHNKLQKAIIHPLTVASKLLQEGVVSGDLVSEVSTQGRSQLQNSTSIITAVTASIHSNPDQFQVFMSVLEDSPESANLATRMRNELSELCKSTYVS